VIGIFLKQLDEDEPMTIVGDGEQRRDFTNVADVVSANVLAWQTDTPNGEVLNVGTGSNHSVNEVAALIGEKTVNIPSRPGETRVTLADNTKAKKLLGWEPAISLPEGISELKKTA
jgi:UDP-glucose 4-epimerase